MNRVTYDDDGLLDDVVTDGGAHLERMDDDRWFLSMQRADGSEFCVHFAGKITLTEDRPPPQFISWPQIRLGDIDWRTFGWRGLRTYEVRDYVSNIDGKRYKGDMADMTLGELADSGERYWRVKLGCGDVGVKRMKELMDRAAIGLDIRKPRVAPDAYTPNVENVNDR